jgi:predicted glycogen debranching enzyme
VSGVVTRPSAVERDPCRERPWAAPRDAAFAARPLEIALDGAVLGDFGAASAREWLEANGVGGWASGTLSGAATRRYHGWLVAATAPPVGRRVLVSKLAESVVLADGARVELDANAFPGAVHPRGFERLERFELGLFPELTFAAAGFRLRRAVAAIHGGNRTVVRYALDAASAPVELELRPFLAGRDIHELRRAAPERAWRLVEADETAGRYRFATDGEPAVTIAAPGAAFEPAADWWRDFELAEERARGFDFVEDLFTPGVLRLRLAPGAEATVVLAAEDEAGDGPTLWAAERARREALLARAGFADPLPQRLVLAADAFVVRRGDGWSLIAGYPWFADWGRDAMIALPGLCLATGRHEEAKGILRSFARAVDRGMLPNRFPDDGEAPEYNTIDASLWFFVAAWRYLEASGDEAFVRDELMPVLDDILAWHGRGTRYDIGVAPDGLLAGGEPGVQLTWMDARVDGRVITPRHGKPVEIQALWINALRAMASLHTRFGRVARARVLDRLADAAAERFEELFWNEEAQALYDVVDGETKDPALRPNQLYALALPWPSLSPDKARRALATVERELMTPFGPRTLAPGDPAYVGRYEGGPAARDAAYHQGTVWPFLLGVWICAQLRYRGAAGLAAARRALASFAPHLSEAGLGSVSEIFDADAPHAPRGALAQAWSVAELLRAWSAVELGAAP